MKNPLILCCAMVAASAGWAQPGPLVAPEAPADLSTAGAQYRAGREQISAAYKADRARCDALQGNAKSVCAEEAKGKEKVAKAELEQQVKPSDRQERKLAETRIDVVYDVARQKCRDQQADVRAACLEQARKAWKQDMLAARTMKK